MKNKIIISILAALVVCIVPFGFACNKKSTPSAPPEPPAIESPETNLPETNLPSSPDESSTPDAGPSDDDSHPNDETKDDPTTQPETPETPPVEEEKPQPNPLIEQAKADLSEFVDGDFFPFDTTNVVLINSTENELTITFDCDEIASAKLSIYNNLVLLGFYLNSDGQAIKDDGTNVITITISSSETHYVLSLQVTPHIVTESEELESALSELLGVDLSLEGFELDNIDVESLCFNVTNYDEFATYLKEVLSENLDVFSEIEDGMFWATYHFEGTDISIMIMPDEGFATVMFS